MNRKLHNTILAFSVTGVMLFLGLVVARPAGESAPGHLPPTASLPAAVAAHARHDGAADAAIAARLEARARTFEAEVARAATTGDALAMTAGFLAATVTEAALVAALADLRREDAEPDADADADKPGPAASPARGSRSTRDLIAVPYFSFARGSRGASRS